MERRDAFLGGVRPGGLTEVTAIRVLVCYVLEKAGPMPQDQLVSALMDEELVNYFELGSALEDVEKRGLAARDEAGLAITEKGRVVAADLANEVPRSVRDRAMAAVLRTRAWNLKCAQYHAEITPREDGRCKVACTLTELGMEDFCLSITVPDRPMAELVQHRFILRGGDIYRQMVETLAEDE